MNRPVLASLRGPQQLVIAPGATHLFVELGTLGEVARLVRAWFTDNLARANR